MDWHTGKCRRAAPDGGLIADGPCRVALGEGGVHIALGAGGEVELYYSDIEQVTDREYRLHLLMANGETFELYFLGGWHGQCAADLTDRRNQQLIRNLLMLDAGYQKEFRGACTYTDAAGRAIPRDNCRVVLYRTSLVVLPERHDFFSLGYSDIESMHFDDRLWQLTLGTDLGESLVLGMLGGRFGELEREISRLTAEMYSRTAAILAERLPGAPQGALERLARVLRQGKAICLSAVQAAAPDLWPRLAAILFTDESGQPDPLRQAAFDHLGALAPPEHIYVGFRETHLSAERDVDPGDEAPAGGRPIYWFLVAIPARNAIAAEVTNESGHATYFYRIDPAGAPDAAMVAYRVREVSRAMQALNFRREVISASAGELAGERFARYRVALRKLPYVRRLRELFLGRAIHSSQEAWERRVAQILAG